jgi:hypothetical protein
MLYRWEYLRPNVVHYVRWTLDSPDSCRPAVHCRAAEADVRSKLVVLTGFVLLAIGCYAFYVPFDAWWYLRFLLLAFPAIFMPMSATILRVSARIRSWPRGSASVRLVALVAGQSLAFARENSAFDSAGEWRFASIGRAVADRLPPRAVVLGFTAGACGITRVA